MKPSAVFFCIAAMAFAVTTLAAAADPVVHVVQKGETLYAIAKRYDISVDVIMKANGIADPAKLAVGMKLAIPGQAVVAADPVVTMLDYTVAKGDTLYSVARSHGVTVRAIQEASSLSSTTLKIGQVLRIPTSTIPPKPEPATPPSTSTPGSTTVWPVEGKVSYLQGKLKGVSIAARPSADIQAIRAGTVISAGPFRGFGLVAFVQAGDGLVYVYGGAGSLKVRQGEAVRRGAIVGTLDDDSEAAAYFFVFKGPDTIDPDKAPRD